MMKYECKALPGCSFRSPLVIFAAPPAGPGHPKFSREPGLVQAACVCLTRASHAQFKGKAASIHLDTDGAAHLGERAGCACVLVAPSQKLSGRNRSPSSALIPLSVQVPLLDLALPEGAAAEVMRRACLDYGFLYGEARAKAAEVVPAGQGTVQWACSTLPCPDLQFEYLERQQACTTATAPPQTRFRKPTAAHSCMRVQ